MSYSLDPKSPAEPRQAFLDCKSQHIVILNENTFDKVSGIRIPILHTKAVDDTSESEIKFNVLYIVGSILIA
jgi:hypothetical protein